MRQMDLALNIGSNYFIHEGIVPGYAASHGCIRVFPLHARFLFYKWAKPGIPGEIIRLKPLPQGEYSAFHLLKRRRFPVNLRSMLKKFLYIFCFSMLILL